MAVEYEISSDVATIKDVAPNTQVARVVSLYSGQITYDDEAGSKFATATIDGKSQRVMLCIAVNGTVTYDDVPCLYSTVDGHRCLNIVAPTETGTPDDVPSLCETVVIDGMNVRAVRCILINETPIYDGVSSTCTFVSNGKTHTAQLVNQITGGAVDVIIKGVAPLSLPDAIANSLSYVKAFGGTEQNGTPTPDAPVDIVCNNGILKVKDSELPVGYKRLTGITYDSNTYYETNEKLYGSDTLTITLSGTVSAGRNVIGAYSGSGDDARNFSLYIYGGGSTSNSYLRHGTKTSRPRYGTGTRTLVMSPTGTDGFLNNVTYEEEDFETTSTFRIGTLPNSTSAKFDGNMIGNITVSNRLKYIPCERVSDGKIGYYETFTGTFLENQGNGTPVSMGYDTSYMTEIYVDGTVETVTTKQAFVNDSDVVDKIGLNSSNGTTVTNNNRCYVLFPCKAGVTYTAQTDTADLIGGNFIEYNQPEAASNFHVKSLTAINDGFVDGVYKYHVVCDVDGWAGWQCKSDKATAMANNWQITSDISSATCEPLLAVGDYTDVQEILSGAITRNVGVRVLDGTENWTQTGSGTNYTKFGTSDIISAKGGNESIGYSTHLVCNYANTPGNFYWSANLNNLQVIMTNEMTVEEFKAYLAAQSAAGTPVIIVYPLATPTTESVTGQTLQVTAGDNTLEITQASMSGLQLEAKYKAAVELTVQEVQDANLDPNVEVTIH